MSKIEIMIMKDDLVALPLARCKYGQQHGMCYLGGTCIVDCKVPIVLKQLKK